MSGRDWLAFGERMALARAVRTARRNRVGWKVIEHLYGRSRWQLRRYLAEAQRRNAPKKTRNAPSESLSGHAGA